MAVVKELLRAELDGTLSFGDYTLGAKTKLDGFEFQGDLYKVKTFAEITKLEKNGMFVYESVPGTAVENFKASDDMVELLRSIVCIWALVQYGVNSATGLLYLLPLCSAFAGGKEVWSINRSFFVYVCV